MTRRRVATALVAALILASVVTAGVAFAQDASNDTQTNDYPIEELQQDGARDEFILDDQALHEIQHSRTRARARS